MLAGNADGYYVVEDTLPGYAAAISGNVHPGDVFLAIDHISVRSFFRRVGLAALGG